MRWWCCPGTSAPQGGARGLTRGPAISMQVCVHNLTLNWSFHSVVLCAQCCTPAPARIYAFLDMVQGSLDLVALSVDGGSNVLHTVPLNDWDVEGETPEEASGSVVSFLCTVYTPGGPPACRRGPPILRTPWRSRGPLRRTKSESSPSRCTQHAARRVHRTRTQIPLRAHVCTLAGPWAAAVRIY